MSAHYAISFNKLIEGMLSKQDTTPLDHRLLLLDVFLAQLYRRNISEYYSLMGRFVEIYAIHYCDYMFKRRISDAQIFLLPRKLITCPFLRQYPVVPYYTSTSEFKPTSTARECLSRSYAINNFKAFDLKEIEDPMRVLNRVLHPAAPAWAGYSFWIYIKILCKIAKKVDSITTRECIEFLAKIQPDNYMRYLAFIASILAIKSTQVLTINFNTNNFTVSPHGYVSPTYSPFYTDSHRLMMCSYNCAIPYNPR